MGEKVLLVEDDAGIAVMLTEALRSWGYDVLHADTSRTAVEIARAYGPAIGVALCDIVLPDGPLPAFSDSIRANCPGLWLIYTSGYPLDVLVERGVLPGRTLSENRTGFLPKPFLPSEVRDAIRRALLENLDAIPEEAYAATTY